MSGSGIRRLRKDTVVIHTKDDNIFRGVLAEVYNDCLVLANPVFVDPSQKQVDKQEEPLGGKAVLPRANISWLQVL